MTLHAAVMYFLFQSGLAVKHWCD